MMSISKKIQTAVLALIFAADMAAQERVPPAPSDTPQAGTQTQVQQATGQNPSAQPTANPGFGEPTQNDVSGRDPRANSTYQKDRNGNQGFDPGWLGLLGLVGLFGLARGGRAAHSHEDHVHSHDASRA
jgi:hypothetical protein